MKFSIITVSYNAAKSIERTIGSVVSQSCKDIEYIVVDGGSIDGTVEIIKKYELSIKNFISEPDEGIYDAMNKGLRMATGDYVWFLNAGDTFKSDETVAQVAAVCEKNGMPDIVYGETDIVDAAGKYLAPRRLKAPGQLNWRSFRNGMLVCHQAFIVKRSIACGYDLSYRLSADFDWCIRCMRSAQTIVNSGMRLVNYQYEGATTANRRRSLKERYKIMCHYYGSVSTNLRHIWFATRFFFSKMLRITI
jgi:glycosyltransferase involved in cell wall biosynthesis